MRTDKEEWKKCVRGGSITLNTQPGPRLILKQWSGHEPNHCVWRHCSEFFFRNASYGDRTIIIIKTKLLQTGPFKKKYTHIYKS